jgi:uncharacterized membrane protein YfcA
LFATGLGASIFGSMVGLGGGFIAVPVLLLFFGLGPAQASGTALALVVANSGSGALTYLLQRRVHVQIGLMVALGGFPGSILGALASARISAQLFDWLFAAFLLVVAFDMIWNRRKRLAGRSEERELITGMPWHRSLGLGFGVGFVSSLFGIGGGVLLVPSLLYFSDLPAHMISATSHFGIVLTSPVGFATHWAQHDIKWSYVAPLVLGGILGGPIGARLSMRLNQSRLMIFVAAALTIAALALVVRHFLT